MLYARPVELSGPWHACTADDDVRREGVGLDFDDSAWPVVPVPGHWQRTPEFATNDSPLVYRHRFGLAAPAEGRRRFITLEGVFYQADVWLDGAYLGDPAGYFFPHSFDITDLSRLADDHVLAIEVACAGQHHKAAKRNITGALQDSDTVDPSWNPGGLWRPVRIDETGAVRIDRLRVLCRDANDARAHLRLHARLDADHPRTVLVRTELDNRDGRLKPAMLASMLIEARPVERMVVPSSAVVRESDEDHVFVAEGDGVFRLLKVKLGPELAGMRVVLSGLKGNEKLVVSGAFHLNNERNRKAMEGA